MGLDIVFMEDIRNALLAANEASASTAAVIAEVGAGCSRSLARRVSVTCSVSGERVIYVAEDDVAVAVLRAFREGYKAALVTVALAFGVSPAVIVGPLEQKTSEVSKTSEVWVAEKGAPF